MSFNRKNLYRRKGFLNRLMSLLLWPLTAIINFYRWIVSQVIFIPKSIGYFFNWLSSQIGLWLRTREFRFLLKGFPAILLVFISIYFIGICVSKSDELLVDSYLQKAKRAFDDNNAAYASMLYERAIQIQGPSDPLLYQLALSLGKNGKLERASYILEKLAPDETPKYGPAHYLRAQALLNSRNNIDPVRYQKAKIQLNNAFKANPIDTNTRFLLAEIYFSEGNIKAAQEHYSALEKTLPSARLQLAKTYSLEGNKDKARELALTVKTELEQSESINKNDPAFAMVYADTLTYLEEYQLAINSLQKIYIVDKKPEIRDAIIQIMITWTDSLMNKDPSNINNSFLILTEALKFHSDNLFVFDRMMKLLGRNDEISKEARKMLEDCITQGVALDMAHTLLGSDAGDKGDNEKAIFHLTRAFEINPNSIIITNNLAWYLTLKDKPELDKALDLVNICLKNTKSFLAQLYDTRGMINLKMGKYESALADMERALPALEKDPGIHDRLSEVYSRLGNSSLSNSHSERAESLRAEKDKKAPQGN